MFRPLAHDLKIGRLFFFTLSYFAAGLGMSLNTAPQVYAMGKKKPAMQRPYVDLQVSILRLCKEGRPSEVLGQDLRLSLTFQDAPLVVGLDPASSALSGSIENGLLVFRKQISHDEFIALGVPAWDTESIRCDLDVNDGNSEASGTIPIQLADQVIVTVEESPGPCYKVSQSDQKVYRRDMSYVVTFSDEFNQISLRSEALLDFDTKDACKSFKRNSREP